MGLGMLWLWVCISCREAFSGAWAKPHLCLSCQLSGGPEFPGAGVAAHSIQQLFAE